jgi:hypothetical protein
MTLTYLEYSSVYVCMSEPAYIKITKLGREEGKK